VYGGYHNTYGERRFGGGGLFGPAGAAPPAARGRFEDGVGGAGTGQVWGRGGGTPLGRGLRSSTFRLNLSRF